jgi:homoserine dehydrogenase
MSKLKIGIFGGGVVGGGVYEIISKCMKNGKFPSLGAAMEISKICVRSLSKPRDFVVGPECKFVTDFNEILEDPSINCVVELMGGTTQAKDVVLGAINANKHVVTANKALVSQFLPEIKAALDAHPSVKFSYEAAVCGGIPVIHSFSSDFLGDNITKVMGIMNGTTNFMLCKMEDEGAAYGDVLKEAQALGFAEADPTADVEGHDVQAKIALLANLAYGRVVPVPSIPTNGISSIAAVDFEYANILRSTIKLIGCASLNADSSIAVYVSPMVVPLTSQLAAAKGPGNMVLVSSDNCDTSVLAGPGAGRYPTANSVVSDILRICVGQETKPFPLDNKDVAINNDYSSAFYVRVNCSDGLGIIKAVGEAAEQSSVSIHAILQNPIESHQNLNFVITTESCKLSEVQAFAGRIKTMPWALSAPLVMPLVSK